MTWQDRIIEEHEQLVERLDKLKAFIEQEPLARLDYVEFFNPETLLPTLKVSPGTHMALAVFVGRTRLIDNARL